MKLARFALAGIAILSSGCYRMTITNGHRNVGAVPIVEDRWRSATVLDIVQIDTPVPLHSVCERTTWSRIEQRKTFLNGLVDIFLAGGIVYESTEIDVYCEPIGPIPPPGEPPPSAPAAGPPPSGEGGAP